MRPLASLVWFIAYGSAWAVQRLVYAYLLPHAVIADWLVDRALVCLQHYPRAKRWLDKRRCLIAASLACAVPASVFIEAAVSNCSLCVCMTASHRHNEYVHIFRAGSGGSVVLAFVDLASQIAKFIGGALALASFGLASVAESPFATYFMCICVMAWWIG